MACVALLALGAPPQGSTSPADSKDPSHGIQEVALGGCPNGEFWCPAAERIKDPNKTGPLHKEHPQSDVMKEKTEEWPEQTVAPKGAKNVLMIVVDDLRPQLNAAYGQPHMKTPYLDKLAQSGGAVTFTRAYAQVAHCAPSRNSFMTSRYPDSLKIWNVNANFREKSSAADPIFPIPQWFKRNGYHVYGGGKIYHPNHPPQNDNPFSWSAGTKFGEIKYFNDHDHGCPGSPGENQVGCGGCPEDKPDEEFYDGRLANWTINTLRAVKRDLHEGEKKPFFIAAGFRRPHTPWNVAQRFMDMYPKVDAPKHPNWALGAPPCAFVCGGDGVGCDFGIQKKRSQEWGGLCRRMYYACVSATDHYIGTVLDEVNQLKLDSKTIVAIFGDHGWHLGEGGLWAKYTNFEHATRVPLIIKAPWLATNQQRHLHKLTKVEREKKSLDGVPRAETFVELVDVYPTLVELAGLPMPPNLEGRSLLHTMKNPYDIGHRSVASSQFAHCCPWGLAAGGSGDAHRECGACEKLPNEAISYMGYAVRNAQYRFVAWYLWNAEDAEPMCNGLMAVELYRHDGDNGRGKKAMDEFEYINLAANLSLASDMHKLKVSPPGSAISAQNLVQEKRGLANPHADAVKYMHEDLLNKFSKAFAKCLPAIAVRSHRQRRQGDKAPPDQVDGMLDAAMYNPFEEQGRYEPDTTCPNPE